jgi:hypothetical protein
MKIIQISIKHETTAILSLVIVALGCFALPQRTQAVSPAPDGGYPGGNTAEGQNALLNLTSGTYNTAVGLFSLESNTTGDTNTAVGEGALLSNTAGTSNMASGVGSLAFNTTGNFNTATGLDALESNTTGNDNTASGRFALFSNTTGAREGDPCSYRYGERAGLTDSKSQCRTGSNRTALANGPQQPIKRVVITFS